MTNKIAVLVAALSAVLVVGCAGQSASTAPADPQARLSVIPAPEKMVLTSGSFTLGSRTRIVHGAGGERAANFLAKALADTRKITLPVTRGSGRGAEVISFQLSDDAPTTAPESYTLSVAPDGVVVSARDEQGLFYGGVTLWQLLTSGNAGAAPRVPALVITDAPRFAWRGLMLDSARHYQSPAFIKRFIDWMALHKLNVLHWHLTDDQAWRLEIRKYPKLTSVGAWRVPSGPAARANIDPATGKPKLYGGSYSQAEVREIVAYARDREITIVPEIELPGHASAAVVAYPELGVSRNLPTEVPEEWGVFTTLYNADEATLSFLEDVLAEVVELFPGQYIHVGGDEAWKDEWEASPAIQARIKELGLKDEHELQSHFIRRMEKFLSARGRKLIGWDEILEGGLAPNATVMSWRGIDGAVAAAQAGHDTVLSPAPDLYLDHWQSDGDPAPGRSNVLTLEMVYKFDPMPAKITPEQRKHILGVQANLWAEMMRSHERVEYQAFPRAAALAEVAWSQPARIDWPDFQARMPAQLARYDALGIHYARVTHWPAPAPRKRTSHQLAQCGGGYLLSLEDDAPIEGRRAVFLVNITNPCWIWKDAELTGADTIRATVGTIPFNFQIGKDAKGIPLFAPATPAGELEVRLGNCEGPPVATLPLAPAVSNHALTTLPEAKLPATAGKQDLCLRFTRAKIDPLWVIDSVELGSTK